MTELWLVSWLFSTLLQISLSLCPNLYFFSSWFWVLTFIQLQFIVHPICGYLYVSHLAHDYLWSICADIRIFRFRFQSCLWPSLWGNVSPISQDLSCPISMPTSIFLIFKFLCSTLEMFSTLTTIKIHFPLFQMFSCSD